ncbi:hypothetical protein G9A89_001573 [Geosiphon pyriformis]|nr:hypothetical protein G9A89_001573 [Geosiphon pyriformis]
MTNLAKQKDIIRWHKDSGNIISIVTETKLRSDIRPWIISKFDELWVFTSGLNVRFCGAGVAIIMNNSLAQHVSKLDEIPGCLISVCLLFKNKLLVIILNLYAGVSISTRFSQAADINSMVSKMVNSSFFVVLGGDFNENRSSKNASFKFCLGLGLSNSRGVKKVIDFILVSENLASTLASHFVDDVSEFFDTNHKSVSISIGLGGLLDTLLISMCRQTNRDQDCFSAKLLARSDVFKKTRVNVQTANTVFSKIWYSKYDCLRNKQSSKFFKLEMLVAKVVWLAINVIEASKIDSIVLNSVSSMELIKHLSMIKKGYYKSKYYESKIAENSAIKKAIDYRMENFCSNKKKIIKSILEHLFYKVVLDHLVVDDELVIKPNEIKLKISDLWAQQYRSLNYVDNNAFFDVMVGIGMEELSLVVDELPNNKAARLSGIPNELWKHCGGEILACLLKLLNLCLSMGAVSNLWKEA